MGQAKAPLILDQVQTVPERWTNKELLGRRAVSPTMLRSHVLNGRREGVRSLSETGWASSTAESMPTFFFHGAIESYAVVFADKHD